MRVSCPRLDQEHGRKIRDFDIALWKRKRENLVLVGSYAKFLLQLQPCELISWIQATDFSKKLALTIPYGASDARLTIFRTPSAPVA